jgi:acyl carrier protein
MSDKRVSEVASLVASVLDVPEAEIGPETSAETFPKWDSLAQLRICMAFEERFEFELGMETIAQATSVAKLAALIP